MKKSLMAIVFGFFAASLPAIEIGEQAPLIEALDQNGGNWKLSEHLGGKYLVIYFYPAAMTGGCTKQACAYRDLAATSNLSFQVVGVSGDPVQNLKWFQVSEKLNFTLLADPDGSIAKAFGVPGAAGEKSIKGTVEGQEVELVRLATAQRWTFIINPEGKVVYRAEKVNPTEDPENVLRFLSSLE
jgi:peroxiredoxin Q/BCP